MPAPTWSVDDYTRSVDDSTPQSELADWVYETVCRQTLDRPGFCVLTLATTATSRRMRERMVVLTRALSARHVEETGEELACQSATRFDQQGTTKLHRDGRPDHCFLMLGYEPSAVASQVAVADYSPCADDLGISEQELLDLHNPMFHEREERLRPYTIGLGSFRAEQPQIVCVNNSLRSAGRAGWAWRGVLHTAWIGQPDPLQSRIINSMLIVSVPMGTAPFLTDKEVDEFQTTETVHRRRY